MVNSFTSNPNMASAESTAEPCRYSLVLQFAILSDALILCFGFGAHPGGCTGRSLSSIISHASR